MEKNYEYTCGPQIATSIKAQCNPRPKRIIESRLCQKAPLKNEFDLIEAECWGVNEQFSNMIYIRDLDKDEIKVLTMQKQISLANEHWYHLFES